MADKIRVDEDQPIRTAWVEDEEEGVVVEEEDKE